MIKKALNKIHKALNNTSNMASVIQKEIKILHLYDRNFTSTEIGITDEKYFNCNVIVSFTTYGKRIYDVYLTIESLMQQTVKPNKIILWLAENEFTVENIPQTLKNLQKRGLTVEFCKDIKSYKKLVPALRRYPNDIIITVDDDVIYQYDLIENLLNSYKQNPELIHFCRGHRMMLKNDNALEEYNKWNWYINDNRIDKLNFPTGVGGVLYPSQSLHSDVIDENIFLTLAPNADDVWFKAMAILQGTLSKKVFTRSSIGEDYIDLDGEMQIETALNITNVIGGKNDEQIKAVFSKYNMYTLVKD